MFWRVQLSILLEQMIKHDVGTRGGIGTDFFMIFDGFWPPLELQNHKIINQK
jgi:hypothetical protein